MYRSTNFNPELFTKNKGFTLLEVLIAIGITALIGLGAWQVLNSAITSSERTQERLEELNAMQKTMLIMARDFSQIIGRSVRDEYGDYQDALKSTSEFYLIELSRVGWRNPLDDKRSDIQRVAYELDGDKLVRHYWNVLDRSQDSESVYRTLINGVESVAFRYMNDSDAWTDKWPPEEVSNTPSVDPRYEDNRLPKALEFKLRHKYFGELRRVFEVSHYLAAQDVPASTGTGSGNGSGSGGGDGSEPQ